VPTLAAFVFFKNISWSRIAVVKRSDQSIVLACPP
jgi:hypothetical protein